VRVDFGHVADVYEDTRGVPAPFMDQIVEDIVATAELDKHSLLLDAGCGTGRFVRDLARRGLHVVGIDISPRMLNVALSTQLPPHKKRRSQSCHAFSVHLGLCDALALPFPNDTFQAYLAIHLFHLLPDWRQVLEEAERVLAPGGILITGFIAAPIHASRLYAIFDQRRRQLGYPAIKLGADTEDVMEALKSLGATLETHRFSTQVKVPLRQTLDCLERRLFSSMWHNLPEVVHRRIMNELHNYANSQFRTPNTQEELEIVAHLNYARFG